VPHRNARIALTSIFILMLSLVAACSSSATGTPENFVVCHQFRTYMNASPTGSGSPLGAFETQWQSDQQPADTVGNDIGVYMSEMEAGDEFPGSGMQQRTAQDALTAVSDCRAIGVRGWHI
jgi:hypothetical protein